MKTIIVIFFFFGGGAYRPTLMGMQLKILVIFTSEKLSYTGNS